MNNLLQKIKMLIFKKKFPFSDLITSSGKINFSNLKKMTFFYLLSMKERKIVGSFLFSSSAAKPVLYASTYAVMIYHLFSHLKNLDKKIRKKWIKYIQSFQSEKDGLFRDPAIETKEAEIRDDWGWRHLTTHCLMALIMLGGKARNKISYLNRFFKLSTLRSFLASQDWSISKVAWTSNAIQNLGIMLQYSRDFESNQKANKCLNFIYEYIALKQNKETGLFGDSFRDKKDLSYGIQAGYHFWNLYFYDKRKINYQQKIIKSILKIQNRKGGYAVDLNSNACEDIDAIDVLVRLYSYQTSSIRFLIRKSLKKAFFSLLSNLNEDGGWVFKRNSAFNYGHKLMSSRKNESNMFATWFRTLSLAYLSKVLNKKIKWEFIKCPGYQFWLD